MNPEGLVKELISLDQRLLSLENGKQSAEIQAAIYKTLNERNQYEITVLKNRVKQLEEDDRKRQRREIELTSERDVARRELDIARHQANETFQRNGVLTHQVNEEARKRKLLRSSFGLLKRSLPPESAEDVWNAMEGMQEGLKE